MKEDCSLLKTIKDFIYENGGSKIVADLIMSENHEYFQNEAVKADRRLKDKGIFTYEDIKPIANLRRHEYNYTAIEYMYPHYTYAQMAEQLNRSLRYVTHATYVMIKAGRITRLRAAFPRWTNEEEEVIIKNGHKFNDRDLAILLGRTPAAVSKRKALYHIRMEDQYKRPAGRYSHKIYKQA